jgi:hypothetical protein
MLVDKVYQRIALLLIIGATVYNHTLVGVVVNHVGVLLQEIKTEGFYV